MLAALPQSDEEQILTGRRGAYRVLLRGPAEGPVCVLLPLDRYFETRARYAMRLWRALNRYPPSDDPAVLAPQTRTRLVLALRALDARQDGASIRQIAEILFHKPAMSRSSWKTHDLRSRTERAVRKGLALMDGEYRQLLLHPHRPRTPRTSQEGIVPASPTNEDPP